MVIKKITLRSTTVAADLQVCSWDCSLGRAEALQLRSATQEGVKIIPLRPSGWQDGGAGLKPGLLRVTPFGQGSRILHQARTIAGRPTA
jgi:hypothetical protein